MSYSRSHLIGKKILYYRKMKGISINEISKVIGISPQQQSRYERGINRLTLD
ncbi:helix-turn-helix transcriptional regulator, partial [Providencia rettgeri]|nr:helix-turn-helix transcriptional regulator [Providencia rettgeri]